MTKDDFQKSAGEMNRKAPAAQKDAAGASSSARPAPLRPPAPGPLVPKAPFGLPSLPPVPPARAVPLKDLPKKTEGTGEGVPEETA